MTKLRPFGDYLRAIERKLTPGVATEPSHYPTLQTLVESLDDGLTATCNPRRIECGAPDFIVTRRSAIVGYIEAKDIGKSLDEAANSDQLTRYRRSLTNLILTDYLEFRWYVGGQHRQTARLARVAEGDQLDRLRAGILASSRPSKPQYVVWAVAVCLRKPKTTGLRHLEPPDRL